MPVMHRVNSPMGQPQPQSQFELGEKDAGTSPQAGQPSMKRVNFALSNEDFGTVRPEGRNGDEVAMYAALVRVYSSYDLQTMI